MKTRTKLVCSLILPIFLTAGCQQSNPPTSTTGDATRPLPSPASPSEPVAADASVEAPPNGVLLPAAPVNERPDPSAAASQTAEPTVFSEQADNESSQAAAGESTSVTDVAPLSPPVRYRILLLAASGPLVIDICLTDGVESMAAWRTQSLQALLDFADADADGTTTWDELLREQLLLNLASSGMPVGDDGQRQNLANSYDQDGNGRVAAEELLRFLSRNLPGEEGFQVSSTSFDPFRRTANSPLTRWIDRNSDGVITTEEKRSAPQRLRELDADDDGRLWSRDFASRGMDGEDAARNRYGSATTSGPRPVRIIGKDIEWNDVKNDLEQIYAFGSPLTRDDLGASTRLFDWLDLDDDQSLRTSEMAGLVAYPADATVSIGWRVGQWEQMDVADDAGSPPPKKSRRKSRSAILRVRGTELEWIVNRPAGATVRSDYGTVNGAVPLVEERFAAADFDKNQYLDRSEFPRLGYGPLLSFERLDENANGQIEKSEFMLLTKVLRAFQESGIQLDVRPQADSVFAALDGNRNGRLDAREIRAAGSRLEVLDGNRDGTLSTSELPSGFTLVLSDRPLANQPMTATQQADADEVPPGSPDWFFHMDFNHDGEIDQREFLGTHAQFERLDEDQDGFLESHEVTLPAQE